MIYIKFFFNFNNLVGLNRIYNLYIFIIIFIGVIYFFFPLNKLGILKYVKLC